MIRADWFWIAVFLVLLTLTGLGVWGIRVRVLSAYTPQQASQRWQQWRKATEAMAESTGPATRSPVETDLPPAYILLKDHFPACLLGVLFTSGVFFGVILWMLRGVLSGPSLPHLSE